MLPWMPLPTGVSAMEPIHKPAWKSGAYLLKARKRVQTLTLLRPKRRALKRVLVAVPEPTTKVGP